MQKICRKNTNREFSITHSLSIHQNRKNCKKITQKIRKTKVLRQIQTLSIKGMSSTSANRRHIYLSKQAFYHQKRKIPFLKGISLAKRELWRQRKKRETTVKKSQIGREKYNAKKHFYNAFLQEREIPLHHLIWRNKIFTFPGKPHAKTHESNQNHFSRGQKRTQPWAGILFFYVIFFNLARNLHYIKANR